MCFPHEAIDTKYLVCTASFPRRWCNFQEVEIICLPEMWYQVTQGYNQQLLVQGHPQQMSRDGYKRRG